jgi:hypothetical protein
MEQLHKKYYIREFTPSENSILVEFVEFNTERKIILPVENKRYLTGQDLDNYIMSFCPIKETIPVVEEAVNYDEIQALVVPNIIYTETLATKRRELLSERGKALASSDWTQLPDVQKTLDEEEKKRWLEFRQALRDITKQESFPEYVDWPKRPYVLGVTIFNE